MVRTSGHTVGGTGLPGRKNWITHELPRAEAAQREVNGGLVVLDAQGLAAASGLRRGDVIISAGPNPITDEKTFKQALSEATTAAPLFVMRGQDTFFLPLRIK